MGGRVRCSKVRAENLSESNEEEMEIGDVPALVKWHMSTTVTPKERTQDSTIWWRQFPWHFYLGEGPSVRRGKHLQKGHEKPDQGEVKSDKCCSLLEMLLTDTWHCPVLITGRRGMRGRPWWRPETDNITKITNRQIPRLPWRPSSRWRSLGKEGLDKFS